MALVVSIAILRLLLHLSTNHNYGFHRDELAFLDDGLYLDWGFAGYPPLTPAIGRLAMELFGLSTNGVRFFGALAQSAAIVLTGDMARRLGGRGAAPALAALCVAVAPISLVAGSLFQYVTFDYLWWVLLAWCIVRLIQSADERWWMGAGLAAGMGLMTKYTMAFFLIALAAGLLATPARRLLWSRWLAAGAAIATALVLPNVLWQVRHEFVTLEFLSSIHERDIRIGRTSGFLVNQLFVPSNAFSIPVWLAGLWFCIRQPRFRTIAIWFLTILALFTALKGRDYYMGPAYPMLFAAGAVAASGWKAAWLRMVVASLVVSGLLLAAILTPMAPAGSAWFRLSISKHGDLKEEIGWPELSAAVARVYRSLPEAERARTGILAGNYGEAGAINLYGRQEGLPRAMSGINSHWLRGYVQPPPTSVIAVGLSREFLERNFDSVAIAERVVMPFSVDNEEAGKPDIYICRGMRPSWPEFWRKFRYFG